MKLTLTILALLLAACGTKSQTLSNLIWSTNQPKAILTVDLTSTLLVNGQPIGTGTGGGIPTLDGHGTNTILLGPVLQVKLTNYVLLADTVVTITGSSNSLVNGTYVALNDLTDVLYTNWTPQLWGCWSTYNANWRTNLFLIWTNTANTNYQITMHSGRTPAGWGADWNGWNPVYHLGSLTNAPCLQPYGTFDPNGSWGLGITGDNPPGSATVCSTNITGSTFFDGRRFVPMTVQFAIPDGYSEEKTFTAAHGFGHTPYSSVWSYVCVYADAATGLQPGDVVGLFAKENTSFNDGKNATSVWLSFYQTPMAGNGIYLLPKTGGTPSAISSQTNFVLQVVILP